MRRGKIPGQTEACPAGWARRSNPNRACCAGGDMSDQPKDREPADPFLKDSSRREFIAVSAVAGLAAYGGVAAAAETDVVTKDVVITTPDGNCDAAFFHPATDRHPGVLIWTDAFGLRPTFRDLGKRLAAQGYAVL